MKTGGAFNRMQNMLVIFICPICVTLHVHKKQVFSVPSYYDHKYVLPATSYQQQIMML